MTGPKILLLDFEPSSGAGRNLCGIVRASLPGGVRIEHTQAKADVSDSEVGYPLRLLKEFDPHLVFISVAMAAMERARALVSKFHIDLPDLPVIIVGDVQHPDEMLAFLRAGAADFIVPPLKAVDIIPRVRRLLESQPQTPAMKVKTALGLRHLIGRSPSFVAEIGKIPTMARCDATVLISGETGTGKELCARAIHYLSPRAKHPFVPINCGAIPSDLAENELFGHERGAYTGAASSQAGIIQEANCGTLFLDEVDCLTHPTQAKMLRFLQDKEYRALGSSKIRYSDVRIIAATNIDLEESVRLGRVRQDLYYRLHIIPLTLIPLRARSEDIPLLASHFLSVHSAALRKNVSDISAEAVRKLMLHEWPGNVRELEHVIERAVVMCEGPILTETDIMLPGLQQPALQCSFQEAKARVVSQFELTYIKGLLMAYRGNISKAARAANKNRRALWELIRKHGIDVNSFKQGAS